MCLCRQFLRFTKIKFVKKENFKLKINKIENTKPNKVLFFLQQHEIMVTEKFKSTYPILAAGKRREKK